MGSIEDKIRKRDEPIQKELETDYTLIPIGDITDEARLLAVAWMECEDKDFFNKHKLASDIMNYARRVQQGKVK